MELISKVNFNKILILFLLLIILLISINMVCAENPENSHLEPNLYLNDNGGVNNDIGLNNILVSDLNSDESLNSGSILSNSNELSNNYQNIEVVGENNSDTFIDQSTIVNNSNNQSIHFNYNGQVFNVSKGENGHFIISYNNKELTCYAFNIKTEDDLKTISNYINDTKLVDDIIIINFINDINLNQFNNCVLFSNAPCIFINGNGVKIHGNKDLKYSFLTVGVSSNIIIENLTLDGFNKSIVNYGSVDLTNVTFTNNYEPISNYAYLTVTECSFFNNKGAKSGGIFITGLSNNIITNCVFKNNTLNNNKSVDICVDDDSTVYVFTLNGFNQRPICKCLNEGRIIFKNTTSSITRNLTIDMKTYC